MNHLNSTKNNKSIVSLSFSKQIQINRSNKDFILFDLDNNNKITAYKLTNDLTRYRNNFQHFRILNILKQEINNKEINI